MPIDVIMPHLGAVAEESTLLNWLVQEGDRIKKGQPIFEAESDKAIVEVAAPESGQIAKLIASPGEVVEVGGIVAIILTPEDKDDVIDTETKAVDINDKMLHIATQKNEIQEKVDSDRLIASPLARKFARFNDIDLKFVKGTGPNGRILKADVEDALKEQVPIPVQEAPLSQDGVLPLSAIRTTIAHRMTQSAHTTAPVTLITDADASALVSLREALGMQRPDISQGISYDILIAKIAAQCLRKHPQVNASMMENGIVQHTKINIGVAVETERGLLVPVLMDVGLRDVYDLSQDLEDKIACARSGKITTDDLEGGTFTITNLGGYGIDSFTPIINLPECAILGIGRIKASPVVKMGVVVPGQTISLSLTFDHRVIDGSPAARFLQEVVRIIEDPGENRFQ
jgi:pyruvate dehydrogenase E2 component (dihydrolipoamide acetyltransferase)